MSIGEVGIDLDGGSYYALCTLPMGFNSAVAIFSTCTDAWVLDHCPQELAFLLAGSGAAMQNFRWILFSAQIMDPVLSG